MQAVREMLLDVDVELEEYAFIISQARNPALTPEDRLKLVEAGVEAWKRLEAAHRQLEQHTCEVPNRPAGRRGRHPRPAMPVRVSG